MAAFNVVRFRVKPGGDEEFLDAHRRVNAEWPGLKKVNMIKTGDRSYCIIAEWTDMDSLAAARPNMIATLNSFRDTLEDLGGGLGVTDPAGCPRVQMRCSGFNRKSTRVCCSMRRNVPTAQLRKADEGADPHPWASFQRGGLSVRGMRSHGAALCTAGTLIRAFPFLCANPLRVQFTRG